MKNEPENPQPHKPLTEEQILALAVLEEEGLFPRRAIPQEEIPEINSPDELMAHLDKVMTRIRLEEKLDRYQEPTLN